MTPTCLLAISIDVECDKNERWEVRSPLGFRGVEQGIGEHLTRLFREYGARPTYLVSPEVMRHEDSVQLLKALDVCELGAHLHPEFVRLSGEVLRTTAVACMMPEERELRDIADLADSFTTVFGRRPLSYRAGRYGASSRSLRILADLGFTVDTSVTPHKLWDYGLDFRGAPDFPYYPARTDITCAGPPGGIVEVPVSLRPSPATRLVRGGTQLMSRSRLRPARRLAKWARDPAWFRPGWSKRSVLLSFVREAAQGEYGGILNMMFHNVDVVSGCSPNARSEAQVRAAMDDLRAVLEETLAQGGCFVTLSEIRDRVADEWMNR